MLCIVISSLIAVPGCASGTQMDIVVVNKRMGYAKVLGVDSALDLLNAVSRAKAKENIHSFDDFYGGDAWGGRMYDVYIPVRGNVLVQKLTFDSSGYFVEDSLEHTVKQLSKSDASLVYRLLTPWRDEEEERLADQMGKDDLKWGLFP